MQISYESTAVTHALIPTMLSEGPEKFDKFEIHSTTYKSVNNQPIGVDVLFTKTKKPGRLPVIVRFHGGYLVRIKNLHGKSNFHMMGDANDMV